MKSILRVRPKYHFTVKNGWTNDPHGIVSYAGKYQMFFQFCPDSITHQFEVCWGRATSENLIDWQEEALAIEPTNEEIGCWSGSAIIDDGQLVLIYTQIPKLLNHDYNQAFISSATSNKELTRWQRRSLENTLISGPPQNLDLIAFRDPFVWSDKDGWKAVIGAGIREYGGAMLQYSSSDLETWKYDGVAAKRSSEELAGAWTAKIWECPQLLCVDDVWVLFISVCDDPPNREESHLQYIAYTIGEYDGIEFTPGNWFQYSFGKVVYATTSFKDSDGKQNLLSWMRETDNVAPEGSPWASSMSLPLSISISDGRLHTSFHKNLDSVITKELAIKSEEHQALGGAFRLRISMCRIHSQNESTISLISPENRVLILNKTDELLVYSENVLQFRLPANNLMEMGSSLDLVLDHETLELLWNKNSGIGALRLFPSENWLLDVDNLDLECCSVKVFT